VPPDPYTVLGIRPDADAEAILEARRTLAKVRHPDAGGSVEAMQELNSAVEVALAAIGGSTSRSTGPRAPAPRSRERPAPPRSGFRQDHPSFTIEALPAEAFEGLLIAGATLGELIDDDPPYLLEVLMHDPVPAWCRLELVPDAGSATVSLATARVPGHPTPDVLDVRDVWIDALNRLDWSSLGSSPPS
jgi:hypothetical protein